ncbi:MAG: hypothetical protein ACN6O7_00550 [Sphingobacterium sp.]
MIHDIQKTEFLTIILLALLLCLFMVLINMFCNSLENHLQDTELNIAIRRSSEPQEESAAQYLDQLEYLVTRIRKDVLEKAGKDTTTEELLEGVKDIVVSFGGLSHPAYQNALGDYIISHSKSICGLVITREDLEQTWISMPRFS